MRSEGRKMVERVEKLMILAGPPACGKTTVLRALQEGKLPEIARRLGMENPAGWPLAAARELDSMPETMERLLLHYDLLRQRKNAGVGETYDADPSLEIMRLAGETTMVTIWTPIEALCERVGGRGKPLRELWERLRGKGHSAGVRKLTIVRETYRNSADVTACYMRWFDFCKTRRLAAHWVMDTSVWEPRLTKLEDWTPPWGTQAGTR